jgi:hypothetical protein
MTFDSLFQHHDPERSRFLDGLFSLFARVVVRCWATDEHAPYADLGRPTLRQVGGSRGSPLDFAFQEKRRKHAYGVLLYCDPVGDGPLRDANQITALSATRTFAAFLDAAAQPSAYSLTVGGMDYPLIGSILIWSSLESKKTRAMIRKTYAFHDILSVEDMIRDLIEWKNRDYQMLLDRRTAWCYDFFRGLRQMK